MFDRSPSSHAPEMTFSQRGTRFLPMHISPEGQLSLERHGAHTMRGLITRVAQRLLALAAGLWHNWNVGDPGRHLTAYDH